MTRLLAQWRQVYAEYRQIKSPWDDLCDIFWGVVITLSALAFGTVFGAGLSSIVRGLSHG